MATEKRLIDANEAYEAVIDLSGQAETKSAYAAFWKAGKEIQKLPTVDAVEVVHGWWKAHKPDCRGYTAGFICSSCGNIVYTDYCMKECEYNYCPHCGAKMDKEE